MNCLGRQRQLGCLMILSAMLLPVDRELGAETIEAESVLLRIIDRVDVPARSAGVLQEINVAEGQRIEKGDPLARIDDVDAKLFHEKARAELELAKMTADNDVPVRSAEAALKFAEEKVQRLEDANRVTPRSVSQSELAEARERVVQSRLSLEDERRSKALAGVTQRLRESDVRLSQRNLELRGIVAPQIGTLTQIYRRVGEWVEPGEKVVQLVRVDRLRAEGYVSAAKVTGDLLGSAVMVNAELPGRGPGQFAGKIVFVHPEIDPVNGQMRVWAEIDNPDGSLRPGMRTTMSIAPVYLSRGSDTRKAASP